MKTHLMVSAGALSLALAALTTPAFAQDLGAPPAPPPPGGGTAYVGDETPRPLQGGERFVIVTRDELTGGLRAPREGDNSLGIMSLTDFDRAYPGQRGHFDAMVRDNEQSCSVYGELIREATVIMGGLQELSPRIQALPAMLAELAEEQNSASRQRTGANVIATGLLCVVSFGWYCGGAVAQGYGNHVMGQAHDETWRVDRETRGLDADQRYWHNEAMLWNMRASIMWAGTYQDYCLRTQAGATLGEYRVQTRY